MAQRIFAITPSAVVTPADPWAVSRRGIRTQSRRRPSVYAQRRRARRKQVASL